MRRLCCSLALIALAAGLASCASKSRKPKSPELEPFPRSFTYNHNYRLFRVTNGLMVALVPDDQTNLIGVDVRYRVGAAEDPPGKTGLAHFVEHLMFQVKAGDLGTIGDQLGEVTLFSNAYTNHDETHFTSTALESRLARVLAIEAGRMGAACAQIDDDRIERERQVVKRELAQRSNIGATIRDQIRVELFSAGHPYRASVSGDAASIDSVTRADVCKFIDDHYGPDRALLVVSGKLPGDATQQLVGNTFGPIAKRAAGKRTPLEPLTLRGTRSEHRLDVEEAGLMIAFPQPAWGTGPAMDQNLLLGFLEARLSSSLGEKDGVTFVGTTTLGGYRGGAAVLLLGLTSAAKADSVTDAVFKEASSMFEAISPLEVDFFKAFTRAEIVARHESFRWRASNVADYMQYTEHNRFLLMDLERTESLTAERLQIHAEGLVRERAHVAVIRPSNATAKQKRVKVGEAGKSFDIDAWRAVVDPALADRPVTDAVARPERAIERFSLANGLAVVLAPNFEYPIVDIRFLIPAGSADDQPGKPGAAWLAAELLEDDLGSVEGVRDQLDVIEVVKMGGSVTTAVNEDYTRFSIRGLSMFSDGLLWQLYFRVNSGVYNKSTFGALKKYAKAIKPEDDRDETEMIRAALFGAKHPYSARRNRRDIASLSRDDVERFRDSRYRARGSTLIVTGRFNTSTTRERIERLFGSFRGDAGAAPDALMPKAAPAKGASVFVSHEPGRVQPEIVIAYPMGEGVIDERATRMVLAELLELRLTSIRDRLGASYGVQVKLELNRGPGLIVVTGEVEPARGGEALKAIRDEIAAVRTGGDPIAADFVRARRRVLERLLADSADARAVGDELETIVAYGLADSYAADLARATAALVFADLEKLIARDLVATSEVLVVAGTRAQTKEILGSSGITGARPAN